MAINHISLEYLKKMNDENPHEVDKLTPYQQDMMNETLLKQFRRVDVDKSKALSELKKEEKMTRVKRKLGIKKHGKGKRKRRK